MTYRPRALALLALGASALGAMALPGCDFADPTRVTNPNLTEQAILDTDRPLRGWVQGLERQLAVAFANYLTEAEIASDNYQNTNTFFDQELDLLNLTYTNQNTENTFFTFADLRESARYGREVVAPADEDATDGELAETYFFEAVAHTVIGQAFTAAPLVPAGPLAPPADHLRAALGALDEALRLQADPDRRAGYQLLQARVHHALGEATAAAAAARAALTTAPRYLRTIGYDEAGGVDNDIESALYDRTSFDDLQPLPRLDFLDPKYAGAGGEDAPVPLLKAEEAHLILAEAALAAGDLAQAKERMRDVLGLVASRPLATVDDNTEDRTQRARGSRPDRADVVVRSSPDAPFRPGLVLTRKGDGVTVPFSHLRHLGHGGGGRRARHRRGRRRAPLPPPAGDLLRRGPADGRPGAPVPGPRDRDRSERQPRRRRRRRGVRPGPAPAVPDPVRRVRLRRRGRPGHRPRRPQPGPRRESVGPRPRPLLLGTVIRGGADLVCVSAPPRASGGPPGPADGLATRGAGRGRCARGPALHEPGCVDHLQGSSPSPYGGPGRGTGQMPMAGGGADGVGGRAPSAESPEGTTPSHPTRALRRWGA